MAGIDESKCVLVTGATAGIGRALALSIANLPSHPTVIGTGRRKERLEELESSGVKTIQMDVEAGKETLKSFVNEVLSKYPDLDTIILCAGIQHEFNLKEEIDLDKLSSELNVNYTSVVSTISFFIPHFFKLQAQGRPCFIVTVTSGLGIVPAPWVPNYSASKAALHSFTMSLSAQLNGSNINVLEIIPPLVESELHDPEGTTEKLSRFWMPLDEYTRLTMDGLRKGDAQISAGMSLETYQRFEAGKAEIVEQALKRRETW